MSFHESRAVNELIQGKHFDAGKAQVDFFYINDHFYMWTQLLFRFLKSYFKKHLLLIKV